MDRLVGADVRLFYGFGVPLLVAVGLIIALAVTNATWMLVPLVIVVLALVGVVIIGIYQMLSEEEDES